MGAQEQRGRWVRPTEAPQAPEGTDMAGEGLVTVTMDQLQRLVSSAVSAALASRPQDGVQEGANERFAKMLAEANRQALRPENPQAPGISVYNPLGERDHPKPALAGKMTQNGIALEPESLDREEIELLNKLRHGDYTVTKTDGTRVPFLVRDEKDDAGRLQKRHIGYRAKEKDDLIGLPGLKGMLREVLGVAPTSAEEVRLKEQVASLQARLASVGQVEPAA